MINTVVRSLKNRAPSIPRFLQRKYEYFSSRDLINPPYRASLKKMNNHQLQNDLAFIRNAGEQKQPANDHVDLIFHLNTFWLFTRSDLKSMIIPNLVFGFASAMSGSPITTNASPAFYSLLLNTPHTLLWLWLNLLLFNIANQRLPSSIVEDKLNKPWRPLPSNRLSSMQARVLLLLVIPTVFISSLFLGATTEVFLLIALTWMYNDLGGGDQNLFVRNVINALGMSCYASGAAVTMCREECALTMTGYTWIAIIGMVTMMTIQVQDLSDQEGDAARGRRTLPLVLGDGFARCTIGIGVLGWSVCAPFFWKANIKAYVPSLVIGGILTWRTLLLRNVEADKGTWKLWCLWMISLYLLPLWL